MSVLLNANYSLYIKCLTFSDHVFSIIKSCMTWLNKSCRSSELWTLSSAAWKTKQSQSMSLWWWMTYPVHVYKCTPPSLTLFCITDTTATIFIWPDLLDLLTEEVGRVSSFRCLGTRHITGSDNKPKSRLTNYLCHVSTCCQILIVLL